MLNECSGGSNIVTNGHTYSPLTGSSLQIGGAVAVAQTYSPLVESKMQVGTWEADIATTVAKRPDRTMLIAKIFIF